MKKRILIMFFVLIIMFVGVNSRVAIISLGKSSIKASDSHGTYTLSLGTQRGTIYDTNMQPITNKKAKYIAAIAPQTDIQTQLEELSKHAVDKDYVIENLKLGKPFTAQVDCKNINANGVNVYTIPERYEEDALAPHIVGYINKDGKGVSGLEKAYDNILSNYSQTINLTYTVDAKRRALAGTMVENKTVGDSDGGIVTTLDSTIQRTCQDAASKYLDNGSVIVMDIENGDILAAVSQPEFSPLNVSASLSDENSPLLNRVFTEYNLGSAFKICVTCAALDSGITKDFTYNCTGVIDVSGREFHCEHLVGHGEENMEKAFSNSCNTYYITIGLETGAQKLLDMATIFGFGKPTTLAPGINSDAGTIPTLNELSSPASVANFSMGQGQLMATSVQVATMVCVIANGGNLPTARLVKGIYDGNQMSQEFSNAIPEKIISTEITSQVKDFMIATVEEGTGRYAKPEYGGAGGKTATAETGWKVDGKLINQAWFAGFYPAETPKYAIVVMCENGSAGGKDAGPVFKYIADSMSQEFGYPKVNLQETEN